MDYPKIAEYINSLNDNDSLLATMQEIVNHNSNYYIPAVRNGCGLFLKWFASIVNPQSILEIGFGAGASTYMIYSGFNKFKRFITLERDINRYNRGIDILKKFNISDVELIHICGLEYLKNTDQYFDFVFLDAVKKEYIDYLPLIYNRLNINGYLIADNTIFGGRVVDTDIEKKYKNGVEKLKEFNTVLSQDKRFLTQFIHIDDGISVSKKNL